MTLLDLARLKTALLNRGIDVEAYEASDLFRLGLDAETKSVLGLDLVRRNSQRRAIELGS